MDGGCGSGSEETIVHDPTRSSQASLWVWASFGTLMILFTMAGRLIRQHHSKQPLGADTWIVLVAGLGTAIVGLTLAVVRRERYVIVAGACALLLWAFLTWIIAT
jgi:hypothetical protein